MLPSTLRATDHRRYAMAVVVVAVAAAAVVVAVAAAVVVAVSVDYVAAQHRSSIFLCPQPSPRASPEQERKRV